MYSCASKHTHELYAGILNVPAHMLWMHLIHLIVFNLIQLIRLQKFSRERFCWILMQVTQFSKINLGWFVNDVYKKYMIINEKSLWDSQNLHVNEKKFSNNSKPLPVIQILDVEHTKPLIYPQFFGLKANVIRKYPSFWWN